jgi:hypothetical protein
MACIALMGRTLAARFIKAIMTTRKSVNVADVIVREALRAQTERRRFIHVDPLDKPLLKEAERRWKEARSALLGLERKTSLRAKRGLDERALPSQCGKHAPAEEIRRMDEPRPAH